MSYMHVVAVMTSVTRHVQHHFYAFHGTAGTDYLLCYWHHTTWGAAQGIVYNCKGAWQLWG